MAKPHNVKQRTVGVHIDEQIDIAVRAVVATRDGTEHAEVARPVLRRYAENFVTLRLQVHGTVEISAEHKNGVLTVRLPAREEAKPCQIDVDVRG